MLALRYHPDKNKEDDACCKFQEINEAYRILSTTGSMEYDMYTDGEEGDGEDEGKYRRGPTTKFEMMLQLFLNHLLKNNVNEKIIRIMISNITSMCEMKSLELLNQIDLTLLNKIYVLLKKYHLYFHISHDYLEKIQKIITKKTSDLPGSDLPTESISPSATSSANVYYERILLHPILSDLLDGNIYKFIWEEDGETYMVPLWHHELVYETQLGDLLVQCIPILPEGTEMDENGDLHVEVYVDLEHVWDKEYIEYRWNDRVWNIPTETLKCKSECQRVHMPHAGIPKITEDYTRIEGRNSIYWNIHMYICIFE